MGSESSKPSPESVASAAALPSSETAPRRADAATLASQRALKVLFAASEVTPFAKTGGLGDVVGALPRSLAKRGHECLIFLPLYRCARQVQPLTRTDASFAVPVGGRSVRGGLWQGRLPKSNVPVYLVEQPDYYERDDPQQGMGIYQLRLPGGRMKDYTDNAARFAFFCRAVLEVLPQLGFWPDVVHCNDWQTGLLPAYITELYGRNDPRYRQLRTLYTIHNLAYQGVFTQWDMVLTGLDWKLFNWRQLEFYGHINFMKAGIVFADMISTVSPRYAQEIQTPEFGCGLESVLRHCADRLVGISNGIDGEEWNPATDPYLAVHFDADTVDRGKPACKAALQQELKLPVRADVPLLGMVSRLVEQKGLDLLTPVAAHLLEGDVQLVVLGTGDAHYHDALKGLMSRHPDKLAVVLDFNEPLAHQIEAGSDLFLMPSQYEPAGLNQLYSLRYGAVPVVRNVGGLSDTVTDVNPQTLASGNATGFMFKEYSTAAFLHAVRRALECWRQPVLWRQIQRNGMKQDWTWDARAAEYEALYRRVLRADF